MKDGVEGQTLERYREYLLMLARMQLAPRLRAKRDLERERSLQQALDQSSARLDAWLAAEQSSPSQRAERAEDAVRLASALAASPEAQRDALVLQHWQGWSLAQIGEHTGRSPAAVAGLIKRGLKQLRVLLKEGEGP